MLFLNHFALSPKKTTFLSTSSFWPKSRASKIPKIVQFESCELSPGSPCAIKNAQTLPKMPLFTIFGDLVNFPRSRQGLAKIRPGTLFWPGPGQIQRPSKTMSPWTKLSHFAKIRNFAKLRICKTAKKARPLQSFRAKLWKIAISRCARENT